MALTVMVNSTPAFADESESLLNFKFNHISTFADNSAFGNQEQLLPQSTFKSSQSVEFTQLDATWTYPWETNTVNLDLGVTLRHLSGYQNSAETAGSARFQEFLPLLHASALFNLPLKGLTAGIEGSHLDLKHRQVRDYKAKVSYEWRKGFGMQGGWQHQQFNLDNSNENSAEFEKNGPFLDFYLNF